MSASAAQIIGVIVMIAGGYLWFVQHRVLWGVICLIAGVLIFVGALHGGASI